MRKRLTKKQRKEALAVARAQLVLSLEDAGYRPNTIKQAVQWNLVKTREALRHLDSIGELPYQFTSSIDWRDETNHSADAAVYGVSLVKAAIEDKAREIDKRIAEDMAKTGSVALRLTSSGYPATIESVQLEIDIDPADSR